MNANQLGKKNKELNGNKKPQVFTSRWLYERTSSRREDPLSQCLVLLIWLRGMLSTSLKSASFVQILEVGNHVILVSTLRTMQILEVGNHIIGTTKALNIWPLKNGSLDLPRVVQFRAKLFFLTWKAMAHANMVFFCLGCVAAPHANLQYNFLVSVIFTPPILWSTINKLFQSLEFLVMNWDLSNMIRSDYASCWSDLV